MSRKGLCRGLLVAVAVTLTATACGPGRSAAPATSSAQAVPFATDLGAGVAALKQGDLNGADQLLRRALVLQPDSAVAHFDLGTAYQDGKDDRDALLQYADALQIDPDDTAAEFNRAVIYTPTDAPLAEYLYRRIVSLQPDAATAYLNLGLIEEGARSKPARAQGRKDVAQAVRLDPALASRLRPSSTSPTSSTIPSSTIPPSPTTTTTMTMTTT